MPNPEGKVALVTGAARGQGRTQPQRRLALGEGRGPRT